MLSPRTACQTVQVRVRHRGPVIKHGVDQDLLRDAGAVVPGEDCRSCRHASATAVAHQADTGGVHAQVLGVAGEPLKSGKSVLLCRGSRVLRRQAIVDQHIGTLVSWT